MFKYSLKNTFLNKEVGSSERNQRIKKESEFYEMLVKWNSKLITLNWTVVVVFRAGVSVEIDLSFMKY